MHKICLNMHALHQKRYNFNSTLELSFVYQTNPIISFALESHTLWNHSLIISYNLYDMYLSYLIIKLEPKPKSGSSWRFAKLAWNECLNVRKFLYLGTFGNSKFDNFIQHTDLQHVTGNLILKNNQRTINSLQKESSKMNVPK